MRCQGCRKRIKGAFYETPDGKEYCLDCATQVSSRPIGPEQHQGTDRRRQDGDSDAQASQSEKSVRKERGGFWFLSNLGNPKEEADLRFRAILKESTPRLFITPILVFVNIFVFLLMVLNGVSPVEPSIDDLIDWGASFGPWTVKSYYPLLSSNYVHIGFVHLAFNMWFLGSLGFVAERLFSNWTFLMLYVLSGVGGSVCSLLWNPAIVSAGASGAIFGMAGGMIAFGCLEQEALPRSVVKQWRTSLTFLVLYNLVRGAAETGVDNAGHVGGLVVGLSMGALLRRTLPFRAAAPFGRRYLTYAGVSLVLILGVMSATGRVQQDALARSLEAELLIEDGNIDEAINIYESLLASSQDIEDHGTGSRTELTVRLGLARAYAIKEEQSENAIAAYEALLPLKNETLNDTERFIFSLTHIAMGQIYLKQDRFSEAEAHFTSAIEYDRISPAARMVLAGFYVDRNQPDKAIQLAEKAVELFSDSAEAHFTLGIVHAASAESQGVDRYESARGELQQAVALRPDFWLAHASLGSVYRETGAAREAVGAFEKAAAQGEILACLNLAEMYANGEGTRQDLVRALKWAYLAASLGDENAQELVELLKEKMTFQQTSKAWSLFERTRAKLAAGTSLSGAP